jgi:hypothetical protein
MKMMIEIGPMTRTSIEPPTYGRPPSKTSRYLLIITNVCKVYVLFMRKQTLWGNVSYDALKTIMLYSQSIKIDNP